MKTFKIKENLLFDIQNVDNEGDIEFTICMTKAPHTSTTVFLNVEQAEELISFLTEQVKTFKNL